MRSWRMVMVVALVTLLAACGRETSVGFGDGGAAESSDERSMTGDPNDTLGGTDPDATGERMSPPDPGQRTQGPDEDSGHEGEEEQAPRAPASTRPAPVESGSTPGSPGGGGGSPPNQGIAVGEPNPGDPDGCPECTGTAEPVDPSATPEPGPRDPSEEPRPGTDNPRPREWESARVHADDVTVTVTWWSGVEPCHVLDRVEVHEQADRVVITIYEGSQSGWDGACTAQAVQKQTDVKLSAPLKGRAIVDGAKTTA